MRDFLGYARGMRLLRLSPFRDLSLFAIASAALLSAACSDDGGTTPGTSSGSPGDAGADTGGGDAGADTGGSEDEAVNNCRSFEDRTDEGASRTLTWDFSISTSPERCIRVRAGQTVTWNGNLDVHPVVVSGGDTPNPIEGLDTASGEVTFPSAGTFGYACSVHPAMIGAIDVVE
jgi:plastocyanin